MNSPRVTWLLASALLTVAAGCGDQTANPIEGSGGASSSASSGGAGGAGGATSSSGGGGQGDCSPGCGDGEVCVEGACHALAVRDSGSVEGCTIVLDDAHVYWAGAEVRIVPKSGGDAKGFSAWVPQPSALAVDDTFLYFAMEGTLARGKKDGGSGFTSFAGDGMQPPRFTVPDGTNLYYTEAATDSAPPSVYETPAPKHGPPGTEPKVFSDDGYGIGNLAVDATDVYYWSGNGLVRKNKTTHAVHDVHAPASGLEGLPSDATGIFVDGGFVYYSLAPQVGAGGTVSKVSVDGGKPKVLVDGTAGASGVFAIDATDVYFMTVSAVMKVSKDGGTPVLVSPLSPPSPFATCMAADDEYVYWVDGANLMQFTK